MGAKPRSVFGMGPMPGIHGRCTGEVLEKGVRPMNPSVAHAWDLNLPIPMAKQPPFRKPSRMFRGDDILGVDSFAKLTGVAVCII